MSLSTNFEIETGLDYILGHFQPQKPSFPRSISTKTTEGRQILVNDRQEAMTRYAQANFVDCRISAYPPYATVNPSGLECFQGLRITTPRNLIVIIDLDRSTFKSELELKLGLIKTLQKIWSKLEVEPTIIWSGNGYHIYLVLESHDNLENVKQFVELNLDQISLKFLRFVEEFLSDGRSDKSHNTTVSFNNCMMRIPGSINSKNNCAVRLVQDWDGIDRPAINYLLADFCGFLVNKKAQELRQQLKRQKKCSKFLSADQYGDSNSRALLWIEKLLYHTPIANGRKYCIWRILVPYLINRRHVSQEDCTQLVTNWLHQCSDLKRLNFNANQKIIDAIRRVGTYGPVHPDKLGQEYPDLYDLLVDNALK
jgi:hypothetical protein